MTPARWARVERVGDLCPEPEDIGDGHRPLAQVLGERDPVDQFHDEETNVAFLSHVVEHADVRVVQRGDRLRLALEARLDLGVLRDRFGQDLDRHFSAQPRVPGPVDLAHAALSEQLEDFVVAERLADQSMAPAAGTAESRGRRTGRSIDVSEARPPQSGCLQIP